MDIGGTVSFIGGVRRFTAAPDPDYLHINFSTPARLEPALTYWNK
ncbi:unnamed protein product [Nezara viridula]|uniref:Uncharacterized protein n=1 Tax=Nezara viridula TaxID=85310 RepID=A0A9P0E803_NEZVI|nr:unnamed protein product [Nezara viridula]